MFVIEAEIKNEAGLHARPASLLVRETSKYRSEIIICKDEKEYNGKSIMGILSMSAKKGSRIKIKIQGEDEVVAGEALKALIDDNFGE